MSVMAVPRPSLSITGTLKFYDKSADSGNIVSRGFCPDCGSSVLNTNSGMPDMLFLLVGSLDDPSVFEPAVVVYTERGHAWDHLDPGLMKFPLMPPEMPGA